MPLTLLAPVLGVVAGIVLRGEAVTTQSILGAAATLTGVAVIVLWRPRPPAEPSRP